MPTAIYPAIIERAGDAFSVYFPDLPGCTLAGRTEQEAALNAEEALAGHLIETARAREAVADPSALDAIARDPEVDEVARIQIRSS